MKRHLFVLPVLLGAIVTLGCNDSNGPGGERFRSTMNGANEKPDARTTPATGVADYTFRNDTLFWVVALSNMTNVSAAHIHIGDANTAGGVIIPIAPPLSNTTLQGFITRAAYPTTPPQGVTFDNLLERMRAGTVYTNVHTNDNVAPINTGPGDFPGGEIRGQINPI